MSSPGTSAIVAPWSIGSWHLLRRMPNAQRKLGSSNASGGKTFGLASNTESLSRVHVLLTYESYPAAVSSSWVPASAPTSSAVQKRGASNVVGSAATYAAHLDFGPTARSCRSCRASAIQPASSVTCGPTGDSSAVSTVIHTDLGMDSTASPPPMSSAATRPHPRPPGASSTSAGVTLPTSTPSAFSQAQSASKSACVRESTAASTATAFARARDLPIEARRSVAETRFLHRGATPAWADARAKVDIEPSRVRDPTSSDRPYPCLFRSRERNWNKTHMRC